MALRCKIDYPVRVFTSFLKYDLVSFEDRSKKKSRIIVAFPFNLTLFDLNFGGLFPKQNLITINLMIFLN